MKNRTHLSFLLFLCSSLIFPLDAANASGNINAFLGVKFLEKNDWEPVETQGEGGVLIDFKAESWPISIALDFLGSISSNEIATFDIPGTGPVPGDWVGTTSEFDAGIRKYWSNQSNMRPYLGGGLAFISALLEGKAGRYDYVRDSDYGVGLWINGGVLWTLSKHFNIGFDIRLSGAEATLFEQTYQTGGFHTGLLLGYRW